VVGEPLSYLLMFVCGIVIKDHMDNLSSRNVAVNSVQKTNEFPMPVAPHVAP